MPIRLRDFGGIIPKTTASELPNNSAQIAENCDLVSRSLRPINTKGDFIDLHTNGLLDSNIDESKVFSIPTPQAPSVIEKGHLAENLQDWIQIRRADFVTWVGDNGDTGSYHVNQGFDPTFFSQGSPLAFKSANDLLMYPSKIRYTDTGAELDFEIPATEYLLPFIGDGTTTYTTLSLYEFKLTGNFTNGGPDNDIFMPRSLGGNYNQFLPVDRIPLTRNGNPGEVYGYLQITDASETQFVSDSFTPDNGGNDVYLGWGSYTITITFDFNYAQKSRQFYYYVQTYVRDRGEFLIESEPSEISDKVVVLPGEYVKLNTPLNDGELKNNIYRSGNSGDDFRLIKELDTTEWIDYFDEPLLVELGLFGNIPNAPITDFLEGSILHPAQFGIAYLNKILYFSDYNKFHVYPSEYTLEFNDDILAIVLSGNTTYVFSCDNVFGVSGGNPQFMSKYLVSNTYPLLNKLSLARIGNRIFYVSNDGLMSIGGGGIVNLTQQFYTRNEWCLLNPSSFSAKVADNSIFLEGDIVNLRFDLEEQIKAITTYTVLDGSVDYQWKSKKFTFPQKETFDFVKIDADDVVKFTVFADDVLIDTFEVEDFNPTLICLPYAYDFEFTIEANTEVRSVDVFERNILTMGDNITLTPENNQAWRVAYLKFPDWGSFAGGICTTESDKQIQIEFYHESLDLIHIETVFNGKLFRLPNLPGGNIWRVSIPNKDHVIRSLVLFARRKEIIGQKIHEFRTDPTIQPWALKRYEALKPISFSAGQVKATSYPVSVTVLVDDVELYTVEFNDDQPMRLPYTRIEKNYSFDIDEENTIVQEFAVATSMAKLKT